MTVKPTATWTAPALALTLLIVEDRCHGRDVTGFFFREPVPSQ